MGNCCTTSKGKFQDGHKTITSNKPAQNSTFVRPIIPNLKLSEIVPSPKYYEIHEISDTKRDNKIQQPKKPRRNLEWNYIFESYSDKTESFHKSDFSSGRGFLSNKKSFLGLYKDSLSKQTTQPLTNFEDSKTGMSPVADRIQDQSFSDCFQVFSQLKCKVPKDNLAKGLGAFNENVLEESYNRDSIGSISSSSIMSVTSRRKNRRKSSLIHLKHLEQCEKRESAGSEISSLACTYLNRGPPSSNHSICEITNRIHTEPSDMNTEEIYSVSQRNGARSGIRLTPLKGPNLPLITEDETYGSHTKSKNRFARGNLLSFLKIEQKNRS